MAWNLNCRSYHRTLGIQKQYRIVDLSTELKVQQGLCGTIHQNRGTQAAVPSQLLREHYRLLEQQVWLGYDLTLEHRKPQQGSIRPRQNQQAIILHVLMSFCFNPSESQQ